MKYAAIACWILAGLALAGALFCQFYVPSMLIGREIRGEAARVDVIRSEAENAANVIRAYNVAWGMAVLALLCTISDQLNRKNNSPATQ